VSTSPSLADGNLPARRAHEEGVIAKRATGLYYSGKRTREWLKFKAVHEQEVVIVGYTEPRRSRK
jgi:bifunctional non-homologous end joining protein LigD